ncbi:hypothetical protein [Pseudanabaena sp. PCC 6802]|uniref:hypothetical protein n=1 Tax=Pseudanabaena sp. PCC 6802 TaxID=118173 RepID=UPI00034675A7|nr:hypothetical protein [Pseudanabaena sp. PCC 6802]
MNPIFSVRFAEAKAREVSGLLLASAFNWEPYLRHEKVDKSNIKLWGEIVAEFSAWYKTKHDLKDKTWKNSYHEYLRRIPADEPVSADSLVKIVQDIAPTAKRSRELAILSLSTLAKFADLQVDFEPYKVRRSLQDKKPRIIPTDEVILASVSLLKNPQWQCAYKLLACYGLRPHELHYLDLSEFPPVLKITDGKTGGRRIYPIPQDWLEIFGLDASAIALPEVKDFGEQMSRNFAAAKVPFVPYDLRHAYAIRGTVTHRVPLPVISKMLGHSPSQHLNTYNYWISQSQIDDVMRSPQ